MVVRACGRRIQGGIYAVVPFSRGQDPNAHPIEEFLLDPPILTDSEELGLSPIGVHVVDRPDGSVWLYDIVGSIYYRNVADYIEEARALGVSRRLPANLPWDRIDQRTRYILLHARAHIHEIEPYLESELPEMRAAYPCPGLVARKHCGRNRTLHGPGQRCARFWWQDIDFPELDGGRAVARQLPEVRYGAWSRPGRIELSEHSLAAFAVFPTIRIEVVRNEVEGSHRRVLERVELATLATRLVDE